MSGTTPNLPPLGLALTPLVALLVTLPAIIMIGGADSVSRIGGWIRWHSHASHAQPPDAGCSTDCGAAPRRSSLQSPFCSA